MLVLLIVTAARIVAAVATADYTHRFHTEIDAATARPPELLLSGWQHMS